MAWHEGQATDYRDLLQRVKRYVSSGNIATVAVNAGGSGYAVGDIVEIDGGTFTDQATVEVLAESSGVVTSVRIVNAGAYSVNPTGTGATTTAQTGVGTGLTLDLTFQAAGWTINRDVSQRYVRSVETITAAGSGYLVNDIVTLDSSGDAGTTPVTEATFRVLAVDGGGAVTSLSVETPGEYTANSSGVGIATTGGTGTGLEIDPLFDGIVDEDQILLQGSGSGADEIFVGIRTFTEAVEGARNWELAGMTGFGETLAWEDQPNINPGRFDESTPAGGAYVPLRDTSMDFWVAQDSRRIVVIVSTGANIQTAHLGFIDPLATSNQYAYPLAVVGTTSEPTRTPTDGNVTGSFPHPVRDGEFDRGAGFIRTPDGDWEDLANGYRNGATVSTLTSGVVNVWPGWSRGSITIPNEDTWANSAPSVVDFAADIIETGVGTTPNTRLEPTPNTGGAIQPIFPLTLIDYDSENLLGQFSGMFWVSASRDGGSPMASGDVLNIGATRYRVFQNGPRTEIYSYFCIEEA